MPGYKGVVPVNQPRPELYCSQCHLLLRDALLTEEGDRICTTCLTGLKKDGVWWCDNLKYQPDRDVDEEIRSLPVSCSDCRRKGYMYLKDFEDHLAKCLGSKWAYKAMRSIKTNPCTIKDQSKSPQFERVKLMEKPLFQQVTYQRLQEPMLSDPYKRCAPISNMQGRPSVIPGSASEFFSPRNHRFTSTISSDLDSTFQELRSTTTTMEIPKPKFGAQGHSVSLIEMKEAYQLCRAQFKKILESNLCSTVECQTQLASVKLFYDRLKVLQRILGSLHAYDDVITCHKTCMTLMKMVSTMLKVLSRECYGSTTTGSRVYNLGTLKALMSNLNCHIKKLLEDDCPMSPSEASCSTSKGQKRCRDETEEQFRSSWVRRMESTEETIQELQQELVKQGKRMGKIETRNERLQQELVKQGKRMGKIEKRNERLEQENETLKQSVSDLQSQIHHTQRATGVNRRGELIGGPVTITKEIYNLCAIEIYEWLDVGSIVPHLMKYKLINGHHDMYLFTNESSSSRQKINFLYKKLCMLKDGFQLFYRCLRETQNTNPGHKDIADKLEETAQQAEQAPPPI